MNSLPVDRLYHPGIVVRDARATAKHYADMFGIERWAVAHCGPERLTATTTFGARADHAFTRAVGIHEPSGLAFELIQPNPGDSSTYTEFLANRGEGVHNLCTSIVPAALFEELRNWFEGHGVELGQSTTLDGVVDRHLFDTRQALGGFYIQVLVPHRDDWRDALRIDEQWDFSGHLRRRADAAPVPLARVANLHFGVVVRDVVATMRRYAALLGLETVAFLDIGSHDASPPTGRRTVTLENATYHGKPVEHGMLSSLNPVADFGFEVIQATIPPIHYKEDFLDVVGEGVHHFFAVEFDDEAEWSRCNDLMSDLGAPVVQSGEMNCGQAQGLGEYFYWDTRPHLGGFVLEAVLARPGFYESFADAEPVMVLNFGPKGESS